jgi:hypothetical protein
LPHHGDLGGGEGIGLVDEVAEGALQGQGFGGEGAGGFEGAGVFVAQGVEAGGGQRLLLALQFQVSAFQRYALGLLLGFSMPYSTRSQSSKVRRTCCWREVNSIRCRTKWGGAFSLVTGPTYGCPLFLAFQRPRCFVVAAGSRFLNCGHMSDRKGFFERHGAAVQTITAVIGAGIALLMLWSLVITRRQLECSMEARLDFVACGFSPVSLGYVRFVTTNYIPGSVVALTNVPELDGRQLELLKQSSTNLSKVEVRNAGAVSVSDVQVIMQLEAVLNEQGEVTNAVYEAAPELLSKELKPARNFVHDFAGSALTRLEGAPHVPGATHVVCFVILYRRTVDMKPRTKIVVFQRWRLCPDIEASTFVAPMPFGSWTSYFPVPGLSPRAIKTGVTKCLEQLDVVCPLDD